MTPGERLRNEIKASGLPASHFADLLGFSRQNFQRFLDAKVTGGRSWPAIAKALGVRVEWLATGDGAKGSPQDGTPVIQQVTHLDPTGLPISLPFLGTVTAGDGWAHESQDPDDSRPFIPRASWGVVRIQGDSAEPVVLPGQSVIVDDEQKPAANRLVVVQLRDGRAYCKRWCPVDGHVVLASVNSGRDSTVVHLDDIERVRVVVGVLFTDRVAR